MADEPKLLLFDGHALVHRAYHGIPPLTVSKTGEPVGAVFGVASMLLKAIADYHPTHIGFAFDLPAPTFRHVEYAEYKAQRAHAADELTVQFPRVKEVIRAFGIPIFELAGFEADDLLGTLSSQAGKLGYETIIITGDTDTFQLVREHVGVLTTRKGMTDTVFYDVQGIRDRYGLEPDQIPDLKALVGDTSDNIKGVPSVGEKTAVKLLQEFGTVEGILERLDSVKPDRIRDAIANGRDQLIKSKWLATIVCDAPVTFDPDEARVYSFDQEAIGALFRTLEFRSLTARLQAISNGASEPGRSEVQLAMFGEPAAPPVPTQVPFSIVRTEAELDRLVGLLEAAESIVVDTETDSKDAVRANLVGIALLPLPGEEAFYVPVGHVTGPIMQIVPGKTAAATLFEPGPADDQLPMPLVLDKLRPTLSDPDKPKVAHNGKYDDVVLAEAGIEVQGLAFDTMIAAYLLNERMLGLKELAATKLNMEMTRIEELIGKGSKQITMAEVAADQAAPYATADVVATARLREILEPELEAQNQTGLFSQVEMPLVPVLESIERCGLALDLDQLGGLSKEIGEKMVEVEQAIYESAGRRFTINSPVQLGQVLFEELKLPSGRRTKTGWSTDAQVLEEIRGQHPIVDQVLEFRQLSKLKSTYVDKLPQLINPKTGRVHTNLNQTVARTGRLSSQDPNLQNIPLRTPLGRRIRQAFVAGRPGTVLLSADYSQIELRILAHITQDPRLLSAFQNDEDIHAATAAATFGVPLDEVTADQRRVAKTINFGVIYGISSVGLADRTDLSRKEAGEFIKTYFETYPGIRDYIEKTKTLARQGRVETLLGRYMNVAERDILSPNQQVRGETERAAINMPIQGTAADIIKIAMIRLHRELAERDLECALLLQIHDELLFEVQEKHAHDLAVLVKAIMESAYQLSIPLRVEVKAGTNWNEMTPLHVP